jgi:hypothetical protein
MSFVLAAATCSQVKRHTRCLRTKHLQIDRVRRRRRRNMVGLLEGVIIMRAGPRCNKGAVSRWLKSRRFTRLSAIEARLLFYAAAAMAVMALSMLPVANIASRAQEAGVHVPVVVDGHEIDIHLQYGEGPQVDDSTYFSERSNPDTGGSWSVQNPDGTQFIHLDYYGPDGNPAVEDVFNPGTDCKFNDVKDEKPVARHVDECRPTRSGDLVVFNVTYYEYTCKGVKRRISHAVPTEKPCNDDAYRVDAQTALGWDEHWPYRGVQPPGDKFVCTATPVGRIRPIHVGIAPENSNYELVIWIDEKGNQFTAIYRPDGTSIWEAAGTVPPKPSKEDVRKVEWQFTPDSIKQAQDLAKKLQKAVEDPNGVRHSLGNGSGAGALTSEELRALLQALLKKVSDDCNILVPKQPKTPLRTVTPEVPKSIDEKPNADKTKQSSRTNTAKPSTAGSPALDPAFAIGIGMGIGSLLGGMHGHGDHNFGGREGGRD